MSRRSIVSFFCAFTMLTFATTAFAKDAAPAPSVNGVRFINPSTLSAPTGYTHVVEVPAAGKTLYISGQVAFNAKGELVGPNDFAAQAEQVFANLDAALKSANATFANVVRLTIYVTDVSQLKALRAARDKYVDLKHPPASTLVEVSKLSRDGLLLEIEAIAVVPAP
ncbi:reactive intermediate/imine deaminase [Luteibacter rhizovicinus]|uniref:Reactive intermediate/imine deaminase n=1 Tax=Luteibacter rhizovicinus TaxID=242606 RepID=A0A4R3YLX1_9GAMM|nr:RidA family protein [Luteibacter rhizovicinus]TCV93270.1 reactive intermediate/imine deaminase [Luteibacter rhizovicinus]